MAYDYITLICPRCGHKFKANYCNNCGSVDCIKLKEYSNGWFGVCTRCDMGWQWWECPKCETSVNVYKNKACFLTNACCSHMGKSDDCEELTILRKFRDEYMLADEQMSQDVNQYYAVAPKLIEKIDASEEKDRVYDDIYHHLVLQCIDMIKHDNHENAYMHYKTYVETLCKEYGVSYQSEEVSL